MEAFVTSANAILTQSGLPVKDISIENIPHTRSIILHCVLEDAERNDEDMYDEPCFESRVNEVHSMIQQLIDLSCMFMYHDTSVSEMSIEVSYQSFTDRMDEVGQVISIKRTSHPHVFVTEKYDPYIMDNVMFLHKLPGGDEQLMDLMGSMHI